MCRPSRLSNKQHHGNLEAQTRHSLFTGQRSQPHHPPPAAQGKGQGQGLAEPPSPQATQPRPEIALDSPHQQNHHHRAGSSCSLIESNSEKPADPSNKISLWDDRQTNTHTPNPNTTSGPSSTPQHTWTRDLYPTVPRTQPDQGPPSPPIPEVPTNLHRLRCLATPHLLPTDEHHLPPPRARSSHTCPWPSPSRSRQSRPRTMGLDFVEPG